jgi:hypothetical protein
MQQSHKRIPSVLASLAVTLAAIGAGLHSACAQDAATHGGMQILVTRYLWLSGINTTIKTSLHRRCGRPGPGTAGNAGKLRNLVVDGCRLLARKRPTVAPAEGLLAEAVLTMSALRRTAAHDP